MNYQQSDPGSGWSWWGIIVTIIVIIVIVIIATVIVWNQQADREAHIKSHALDLSHQHDTLIVPQIMAAMSDTPTSDITVPPEELALLLYQQFNVVVPDQHLQMSGWDSKVMKNMIYNARNYSAGKDHVWDLRAHIGLPLLIVASENIGEVNTLFIPDQAAVAQLDYLIKHSLVDKAHKLIDEMLVHRFELLQQIGQSTGWQGSNTIISGYWWIKNSLKNGDDQIFCSKEYPKGITGHRIGEVHRLNMLCTSEDFDRLLLIYKAHHLEQALISKPT